MHKKIFVIPSWLRASHLMLVCLSLLVAGAQPASAGLLEDLTDGQHVLLMRHADAPGVGDPPGYRLDQCSTQRNLGEVGRQQSVLIGRWLTAQGVSTPKIFSSAWCRCVDTGRLLALGSVTVEPSLNSFFEKMFNEIIKQNSRKNDSVNAMEISNIYLNGPDGLGTIKEENSLGEGLNISYRYMNLKNSMNY